MARWRLKVAALGVGAAVVATTGMTSTLAHADDAGGGGNASAQSAEDLADLDTRPAAVPPSSSRRSAAADAARSAPAQPAQQTWNRFGSPGVVLATKAAPLASGLSKDPTTAARQYLEGERAAYGLSASDIDAMEVIGRNTLGDNTIVMLRQKFGELPAGVDGTVTVAVKDGAVRYVNSNLAPADTATLRRAPAAPKLTPEQALARAATHIGAKATDITERGSATGRSANGGWRTFTADGLERDQRVKEVAVPVPGQAARAAYHVEVVERPDKAYAVYVDAVTGEVLVRENLVDHEESPENPQWKVFTPTPPLDYSTQDTRATWCWTAGPGCTEAVANPASPQPWDIDPATDAPSGTTVGNNAFTFGQWTDGSAQYPPKTATRQYAFPWTNAWQEAKCNPDNYGKPGGNDVYATATHMFAMHNRLHDWSYNLGFTETAWNLQEDNYGKGGLGGDSEEGWSQYDAVGNARNNAFQGTGADGGAAYTGMYLYQPIGGSGYSPCVDGGYDTTVVGHEYTHAISNRMAAGPDRGLSSHQARSMGESWSDMIGLEFIQENGFQPLTRLFTARAVYTNANADHGNRTYNFATSPLNYSNVGYDVVGPQVHSDGAIWSATLTELRARFVDRYGLGDAASMKACATGKTPVESCPGSRRWAQVVFDAWLLMSDGNVSMLDARNAMLAADLLRFDGANQDILWNTFAKRGMGQSASSNTGTDTAPRPGFDSPRANNATLRFTPVDEDGRVVAGAKLYVGDYSVRSRPVADTDPATTMTDRVTLVPGPMTYTVTAPGYAQSRVTLEANPGQVRDFPVKLVTNLASTAAGATVTGEGTALPLLVDGDEATNAATVNAPTAAQREFTVDLAGGRQIVRRIQVSAMTGPSTGVGRFQTLRQFEVLACDAKGAVTCTEDRDYRSVYASAADAFPGDRPKPVPSQLLMRSFEIPQTPATHLRLRMVTNQCTGGPDFQGEQDNDPRSTTDCPAALANSGKIGVAEFQAMRR